MIGENLDQRMPLINSGGVIQTPWSEGQAVRHLEPMGFIKFDLLGLATLKMIEGAVTHILKRHHGLKNQHSMTSSIMTESKPDVIDLRSKRL